MSQHGGEDPAIRTAVRSGTRGAAHHVPPSRRKIQGGDIVWVDFSASYNRYHADLARIYSIGEPDPRWTNMYEKAAGSVERVLEEMRPGDPMRKLHDVANAYIEEVGLAEVRLADRRLRHGHRDSARLGWGTPSIVGSASKR